MAQFVTRQSGYSTFVLLMWLPNIQSILPIVPRKMSFWGSPQINLLSHHLPDSRLFVLNSQSWLDSRLSSLDFTQLHISRPLLDSRLSCGNLDYNSSSDSRLSTCNSETIATCCFSHGPSLTPIKTVYFYIFPALAKELGTWLTKKPKFNTKHFDYPPIRSWPLLTQAILPNLKVLTKLLLCSFVSYKISL